jgi:hypothetical protein
MDWCCSIHLIPAALRRWLTRLMRSEVAKTLDPALDDLLPASRISSFGFWTTAYRRADSL